MTFTSRCVMIFLIHITVTVIGRLAFAVENTAVRV